MKNNKKTILVTCIASMLCTATLASCKVPKITFEDTNETKTTDQITETSAAESAPTEDMTIYEGFYIAGEDIAPGKYNMTVTSEPRASIFLYDSIEAYQKNEDDLHWWLLNKDDQAHVNLKEGNLLYVKHGEAYLEAQK